MRLIESYLSEVGRYLPAKQRGDILNELRVSLEEQVLEIAGDSAPGLDDEKAAINSFGHPLQVASGFQGQRYLIGPEIFPSFVLTLKTVLIVIVLIQMMLMFTAYASSGWSTSAIGLAKGLLEMAFWSTLVVIAIFAGIEYSGDRMNWYENWTADSVKPTAGKPIEHGQLITNLITEGVFLLWWNNVLQLQNWIPGAHDVFTISLGEVWTTVFWPLNALAGAWFLLHAYVLFRGLWQRWAIVVEATLGALFIALGAWLLTHPPLVVVSGSVGELSSAAANRVVATIIIVIMAISVWDSYVALRRLRSLP